MKGRSKVFLKELKRKYRKEYVEEYEVRRGGEGKVKMLDEYEDEGREGKNILHITLRCCRFRFVSHRLFCCLSSVIAEESQCCCLLVP